MSYTVTFTQASGLTRRSHDTLARASQDAKTSVVSGDASRAVIRDSDGRVLWRYKRQDTDSSTDQYVSYLLRSQAE